MDQMGKGTNYVGHLPKSIATSTFVEKGLRDSEAECCLTVWYPEGVEIVAGRPKLVMALEFRTALLK